jgi:hypothetical protein
MPRSGADFPSDGQVDLAKIGIRRPELRLHPFDRRYFRNDIGYGDHRGCETGGLADGNGAGHHA